MKEEKWDRDFNKIFQNELGIINEKPPVDDKDKFAREKMIEYAIDCIGVTEKVVKDIVKDDNLICEYHVRKKEMTMIKDILGKVDYLTKKLFIELKTKPPNIRKVKRVGSIGEVIDVKRGYARNFLIANKKALYASKENILEVEKIKTDLSKKDNEKKKEAIQISEQIKNKVYSVKKLSTEKDRKSVV